VTILAGARLGPYEVVSRLGAGGRGEVWRARDPRLNRDVAIKVCPQSFLTTTVAQALCAYKAKRMLRNHIARPRAALTSDPHRARSITLTTARDRGNCSSRSCGPQVVRRMLVRDAVPEI